MLYAVTAALYDLEKDERLLELHWLVVAYSTTARW